MGTEWLEPATTQSCLFGAKGRINPCGSLASDGIRLNVIWVEQVKLCMEKNECNLILNDLH